LKKPLIITFAISFSILFIVLTVISFFKKNRNCKGLCTGCNGCKNNQNQSISYYINKEEKLLDDMENKQKVFKPSLAGYYSKEEIDTIINETNTVFISLIPDIPYIGGDASAMTEDIEQAAMVLAFYRVQKEHGRSTEEIGKIITESVQREINKFPKWVTHIIGGKFFTKRHIEKLKKNCITSQSREYDGNWVTFYVEGDGKTFDYGYNHVECGIVKYLAKNNASDLIPYLCSLDFIYSDAFDEGLVRTSTIAENKEYCDFRYKRER